MTRAASKTEPLIESESAVAPGTIPPGVDAQVNIKYNTRVVPPERDGLTDVLDEELETTFAPLDPLSSFLDQWANFAGYNCVIVRLPDPAARRMSGNTYARPCFETERLGDTPFDPVNFIGTLQMLNNNSGGVFRCFLTDEAGQLIPQARIERFAIADPPRGSNPTAQPQIAATYQSPPLPRTPELSEFEKDMKDMQRQLLKSALDRAMNPPPPPPPSAPQLPPEQQLAMAVFSQTDALSQVIAKIGAAINTPAEAANPTWKDKAFDYLMQNPTVGNQITGILDRAVAALANMLPAGPPPPPPTPRPYVEQAPPPPHQPSNAQQWSAPLPPDAPTDEPLDDDEDENMEILDELFTLIVSGDPITIELPIFQQLAVDFPKTFPLFVQGLARTPHALVLTATKNQSPLYKSLLEGPDGERLAARVAEVQTLAVTWVSAAQQPATPTPKPDVKES